MTFDKDRLLELCKVFEPPKLVPGQAIDQLMQDPALLILLPALIEELAKLREKMRIREKEADTLEIIVGSLQDDVDATRYKKDHS